MQKKSLFNAAGNAVWFNIYVVKPFFKGRGMKQFMQRVMKQAMNRGLIRRKMLLFINMNEIKYRYYHFRQAGWVILSLLSRRYSVISAFLPSTYL
jgi:hypothetical protein